MSEIGNRILCLKFNHSRTLLYIGTSQGFRIARLEDSKIISRRDRVNSIYFPGGFRLMAPLHDTQKILVVGSKDNLKFKENEVHIWDEYHASFSKPLEFSSEIKNLLVRREYLAVVLSSSTFVYNTSTWKLAFSIETGPNPNGVGAISQTGPLMLLAPGSGTGQIRLENCAKSSALCASMHENPINCVSINCEGTIAASSSEYGTVIRVFSCEDLQVLHELRRGTISAKISSLSFSQDSGYLIAASNKSTVHIWNLEILAAGNKSLWMLPTYFQYQRSYFKVHIKPEYLWICELSSQSGPSVCMTEENLLYVAHLDGNVYSYAISCNDPELKGVFCYLDFEEEFIEDDKEWTSLE